MTEKLLTGTLSLNTTNKCIPPDFKFHPNKLTDKKNPKIVSCYIYIYIFFFVLFNAVKTDTNLTLHHMGILFLLFNLSR